MKLVPAFGKLKESWNNSPLKLKGLVILFCFIFLVLISSQVYLNSLKPSFPQTNLPSTTDNIKDNFAKLILSGKNQPFFALAAKTTSKFGILPKETFILKTTKKIDSQFIRDNLKASVPFSVQAKSDTEFWIAPTNDFQADQPINIQLAVKDKEYLNQKFDHNYQWSFQTQGKFKVVSVLPGDKKNDVPLNTGIEITFSQDDYQDPKNLISITPSIKYRLERHNETLVVIPEKPLTKQTVYSVTLKKGLNLVSRNDSIQEDFTFSFQTGDEQNSQIKPSLSLDNDFVQVNTKDNPAFKVFTDRGWDNSAINVKVYKFPDNQSFIKSRESIDQVLAGWYKYFPEKNKVPVDNLQLVSQTDLKINTKGDSKDTYFNISYLELPNSLPQGFYLIQFTYLKDQYAQAWLQVTDLSGFVSVGINKTTIWANDLDDNQPAGDASVRLLGENNEFKTDNQGVIIFDTPSVAEENTTKYFEIVKNNKVLILPVELNQKNKINKNDYWSYLYHERTQYKPTDTIYYWGVIKNRDSGQPPGSLTMSLESSRGYYETQPTAIQTKTIATGPEGSYFGSFSFSDLPIGSYTLSMRLEGVVVESNYLSVVEYKKPEIKIEVTAPKKAIFSTDSIEFTAKVTFYDGTPASLLPMKIFKESGGLVGQMTTDKQGVLKYQFKPEYSTYNSLVSYQCITLTPSTAQEGKIEGQGCIQVFNNRYTIESLESQEGDQASLKATVYEVDLDKLNSSDKNEYLGKPASNVKVTLATEKTWWETVEKGTYYDFVEKVNKPSFDYEQHQEKDTPKDLVTNDKGEISHKLTLEKNKSYSITLSVTDKDNHSTSHVSYYYYALNSYGSMENTAAKISLDKDSNIFSLNEEVNISLKINDKDYSDTDKNRFLYIISQRGNQETFIEEKPKFKFQFSNKYLPNVYVSAIIFTGNTYQITSASCNGKWSCYDYYYGSFLPGINLVYKKENSQLKLTIDSDKTIYQPGNQAQITVTVQRANQEKVADAPVNIVLVDEAMEAIGGVVKQSVLSTLYENIPMGIYYSYYSHKPILPQQSAAERGGGGGGRDLFKDTAFFDERRTDSNGQAVFSLKLPDNITTWLIYAQTVDNQIEAGQEEGKLVVSQDFFVLPSFISQYLSQDKPKFTASSFGKNLGENDSVNFQANFYLNDKEISKTSSQGKAFKFVGFDFPQLDVGDYFLTLSGQSNNLNDKITLPFKVISERLTFEKEQKTTLKAGQNLNASTDENVVSQKPTTLVVSDEGKGKYYWQLVRFCYQQSNRLEKSLAQVVANDMLKSTFNEDICPLITTDLTKFQGDDGGLSQVVWGSSNLETTLWATYVNSSIFDVSKLSKYLDTQLSQGNSNKLQKIQAVWALDNINVPKINELNQLSASASSLEEKIYAGLALASIGEMEKARDIYYSILADYAYEAKPYIRIQIPNDFDINNMVKYTGMTLLLGQMVNSEYNPGLYTYIRDYRTKADDVVLDLSEMAFIQDQLNKVPVEFTSINFHSSARDLTKELKTGEGLRIEIAPNERNDFSLKVLTGKAEVTTQYFVNEKGLAKITKDNRLTLKRSYTNVTKGGISFETGDIVKVELDFTMGKDSPRCGYKITDFLPFGLAYLANPGDYGLGFKSDYANEEGKNTLSFFACNDPRWLASHGRSIIYYARTASAGTFNAEPAIMQANMDPSIMTYTDSQKIDILNSQN